MKTYSINILKLIMLVAFFAGTTNIDANAQVTSKTCWKFGSSAVVVNSSVDKIITMPADLSSTSFSYTQDGLTIARSRNRTSLVKVYSDNLFENKTLAFSFSINTTGTLYVGAYQRGINKDGTEATEGGSARTVTATVGDNDFIVGGSSGHFNSKTTAKEGSIAITGISGTTTVSIESNGALGWSYIMWEPDDPRKDLTLTWKIGETFVSDGDAISLDKNDNAYPTITTTFKDNGTDVTSQLTGDAVTWTFSNESSVKKSWTSGNSGGGIVLGTVGTSTFTVAYPGDATYKPISETVTITVTDRNAVKPSFPMTATIVAPYLSVGETTTAGVTVDSSLETLKSNVTYTSSNTSVATVSGNRVTAVGTGTCNITANYPEDATYSATTSSVTLTVTAAPALANVAAPTINTSAIAGEGLGLTTGNSQDLSGKVTVTSGGTNVTNQGTMSYSSPNSTLSISGTTVSANSGVSEGQLKIDWVPTYTNQETISVTPGGWGDTHTYNGGVVELSNGAAVSWWIAHLTPSTNVTHVIFELEQPIDKALNVTVQYYKGDGTNQNNNDLVDYTQNIAANSKYLYVPLYTNKKAAQVFISNPNASNVNFKINSMKFASGNLLPTTKTEFLTVIDKNALNLPEVRKTWIGAMNNQPLSTLEGTGLGLTTTNTVKAGNAITTYWGTQVVRPSGNQVVTSPDGSITVTNTATSQYDLKRSTTTTEGKLVIEWHPWDSEFYNNLVALDSFTQGGGSVDTNNSTISISNSNTKGVPYSGADPYYTNGSSEQVYFNHFQVELTEPTPSSTSDPNVTIAVEYTDGKYNYEVIEKGSRVLYVPIDPNKKISLINIGTTGGTITLHIKNMGFTSSEYLPAYGEINNIEVVEGGLKHINQRNELVWRADGTPVTTTESIDGHTYYVITYGDDVKVNIINYLDDNTIVPNLQHTVNNKDIDPVKTDGDGNTIPNYVLVALNSSTNKGEIVTNHIGRAYVNAYLKDFYTDTYENQPLTQTYIKIVAATPIIRTLSGGDASDYSGTTLGLATNNSVNLNTQFKVYFNGVDVTDQGTFSYSEVDNLILNGSTVSSTVPTTAGKVKVTWTPTTEGATKFNAVTATVDNIEVVDHRENPVMTINPNDVKVGEAGYKRMSDITITVVQGDDNLSTDGLTFLSADENIAKYEYDSTVRAYVIKGYSAGKTTITVTYPGDGDHHSCTGIINVTVKQRIGVTLSPRSATVKQGESYQMSYMIYNDKNNNGKKDSDEDEITTLTPEWSSNDFIENIVNKKNTNDPYKAYIRISDTGLATALNPGNGPYAKDGYAKVKISIPNTEEHTAAADSIRIKVTDNTLFDYMGWDLQGGHDGVLFHPTDSTHYIHWRFAAPEGEDVYVYRFQSPKYEFVPEMLSLNNKIHTSEKKIDEFYETKLTDTKRTYVDGDSTIQKDAKGDAYLEYNGMIAGYGTEKGGRYMTPISGTFVRIEAEHDGVVTVRLRHNGSLDSSNSKDMTEKNSQNKEVKVGWKALTQARRALFVVDENGVVMPRTSNYSVMRGYEDSEIGSTSYKNSLKKIDGTYARISAGSTINSSFDAVNDAYTAWFKDSTQFVYDSKQKLYVYTDPNTNKKYNIGTGNNHNFSKNAFYFCRKVMYGYPETDAGAAAFNSERRKDDPQVLFYSATDSDVKFRAPGVSDTTYFFSKYGYEVLGATHIMISFPVKAGKTYFVGANKSKVGLCSVEFLPDETYGTDANKVTPVTLYEDATTTNKKNSWLLETNDEEHLNVTLDRAFTAYRWHPLVLPFSVSETMLKSIFGENVQVLSLDGGLSMMSSMNNYATRDGNFYDYDTKLAGTGGVNDPNGIPFNGHLIKYEAVRNGSVTFTRHYYQMIYANCPVFLWTDQDIAKGDCVFENVTFQKYTKDKRDTANTPAINDDYTVKFPYFVDRQIGNGTTYDYVMKASYVQSTPENEIYYINNIGTSTQTKTYLYHALAGQAPTMKGTRVWIEPGDSRRQTAPLRTITMQHFWGEEFYNGSESGICEIINDQPNEVQWNDENVYDITGRIVGYGSLDNLRPGLYIYKGTKCVVK